MFGGRRRRVEKLSLGAVRNLEQGESIHELVQTQTGQPASANAAAVMRSEVLSAQIGAPFAEKVKAGPHILVATERNLYAMTLSGARLLNVGEIVLKVPLEQADLRQEKAELIFEGTTFHVIGLFGEHADRLYEYVSRSGAPSGS